MRPEKAHTCLGVNSRMRVFTHASWKPFRFEDVIHRMQRHRRDLWDELLLADLTKKAQQALFLLNDDVSTHQTRNYLANVR
jgi:hypothetical protein